MQAIIKVAEALGLSGSPEAKIQKVRALFENDLIPTEGKEFETGKTRVETKEDGSTVTIPVKVRGVQIDGKNIPVSLQTCQQAGKDLGYELQKVVRWVKAPETTPAE